MPDDPPEADFLTTRIENGNPLPLILEPVGRGEIEPLVEWLRAHDAWVQEKMTEHGALLLRGFAVRDAAAFESVAAAIAPGVTGDFIGTPGNRFTGSVYRSSEGPTMYPIPQHCELMYLPRPPTRIFFGCLVPPEADTGETPLSDNRRVWRELDPEVRERFVRGGLRIVRNLRGPRSRFRFWTQVRWDEYFLTTERAEVEAQCREAGFGFAWTRDDGLRLLIDQAIVREHPVTGETAWCNQFLSYHPSSTAQEFRRIHRLRPDFRHWYMCQFVSFAAFLKERSPMTSLASHCTYADGSRVPPEDLESLRETVWRNLARPVWRAGDVMAVDNFAVSHGRFPSWGPRKILACMA